MSTAAFLQSVGLDDYIQPFYTQLETETGGKEATRLQRTLALVNAVVAPTVSVEERYHPATRIMKGVVDIVNQSQEEPYQFTQAFIEAVARS